MTEEPLGILYHSRALYGNDMKRLRDALNNAGFDLELDPLSEQADLVKLEDGDD